MDPSSRIQTAGSCLISLGYELRPHSPYGTGAALAGLAVHGFHFHFHDSTLSLKLSDRVSCYGRCHRSFPVIDESENSSQHGGGPAPWFHPGQQRPKPASSTIVKRSQILSGSPRLTPHELPWGFPNPRPCIALWLCEFFSRVFPFCPWDFLHFSGRVAGYGLVLSGDVWVIRLVISVRLSICRELVLAPPPRILGTRVSCCIRHSGFLETCMVGQMVPTLPWQGEILPR